MAAATLRRLQPGDDDAHADPAARHRTRAWHRHRGRLPARGDVRSCRGLRGGDVCAAGRHRRSLLFNTAVAVARNIGRKRAMELLITGEPIDARTAQAWGLINRVVPAEALDAEVRRFAPTSSPPIAVRPWPSARGRSTVRSASCSKAAYDVASEAMACNMCYEDAAVGIDAFLGRQRADWPSRWRWVGYHFG